MKYIIVTNNHKVFNFYKETDEIIYLDKNNLQAVLTYVKNNIYDGHNLLSDPILYNLENSQNPFKSILISKERFLENSHSKEMIDGALHISLKLHPLDSDHLQEDLLEEFRFVDLNLLTDSIKQLSRK
ncbi:GrdX family protein [Cetobacterium sp. SF1]|uniref:GrdX family protein n=1 Tax=unclassified Cetobacterium TaxID=2630983 RepID=UPI003CF9739C